MAADWLIYGANGYTGELVAREAVARGRKPILAGRNGLAVTRLAAEVGCAARVFALDDPAEVRDGLGGVAAVLHCAGPFARTWKAMSDGCLETGAHYLDVTGEIPVFEGLAARHAEGAARGITLLPGVGFDVVPTDCLAAHLARRLPSAERLTLAFQNTGGPSRGTARTVLENAHRGGAVRKGGRLVPVPTAWKSRRFDFGDGPRLTFTIPWGDLSTAFRSTGIGDIEVYMAGPAGALAGLRLARPFLGALASPRVRSLLLRRFEHGAAGPTAEERAAAFTAVVGEVEDAKGGRAVSRLRGPDGYDFTVRAALAAVERVLAGGIAAGFQTPSLAFGPDFVLGVEGVSREDLE